MVFLRQQLCAPKKIRAEGSQVLWRIQRRWIHLWWGTAAGSNLGIHGIPWDPMVQLQDIAGWAYIFVQKCGQEMEKTHETMQNKCIMHTFGMFTIHQHDIPFFPGGFRHIAELFWTWQAFFHRSPDYDPVGYDEDIPRSFAQSGWAKAWEKTAYNKDDAMDHEFLLFNNRPVNFEASILLVPRFDSLRFDC